jgi:pSer/pThr/pTyr-binding forkhead associated (FHA) protein
MLTCPRCHHLNGPGERVCELCGADLPVPEGASGARESEARAGTAAVQASSSQQEGEGGLTAALLDALEQESKEGRARGEGPQPRSYMLRKLPVPDDLPAPNMPAGVPLAARVRSSGRSPAVPETGPGVARPARPARSDAEEGRVCADCKTVNPPGNRFCGGCGARLKDEVAVQVARPPKVDEGPPPLHVTLVCINEDGTDGAPLPMTTRETIIGRGSEPRFATDAFLSPQHARLTVTEEGLFVEDLDSLNGTFVRIREPVKLGPKDHFLMGRQVLMLDEFEHQINPKARSGDGTRYMGSPIPTGRYVLRQIGIGGIVQNVYCLPASGAVLGRERGDITFPGDKFMSARHAQVTPGDDGEIYLTDLNSSNGTWIKINDRQPLRDQDFIFLGQQLFRVNISPGQ